MSKIEALLLLDVQDDFHSAEVGSDDIIKDFADALSASQLVGNFLFIGARSLLLKERGRTDVIRSLEPHSVGLHMPSNAHPGLPEYASNGDWLATLREVERREVEGVNIIRDVFGRDACAISQHGYYAAPHIFPVAAKLGLPYIYGYPAAPPKFSVSWYAGALNFPWSPDPAKPVPFLEVGDESWSDPKLFDDAIRRLERSLDKWESEGQPIVSVFLSHPYRVRVVESVEYWQYINGRNVPKELWRRNGGPRLRSERDIALAKANIRKMAEHLRRNDRIKVIGIPEAAEKYGYQPREISREQLQSAGASIRAHRAEYAPDVSAAQERPALDIPIGRFSPAEVLVGLADSIVAYAKESGLPPSVKRREVLGPLENPIIVPEVENLEWSSFVAYLRDLLQTVAQTGHLPANVGPVEARVGIGSLLRASAEVYHHIEASNLPDNVSLPRFPRYPRIGRDLGHLFADVIEWEMVNPELNAWNIAKHGRLQSWTLKPAWGLSSDA